MVYAGARNHKALDSKCINGDEHDSNELAFERSILV